MMISPMYYDATSSNDGVGVGVPPNRRPAHCPPTKRPLQNQPCRLLKQFRRRIGGTPRPLSILLALFFSSAVFAETLGSSRYLRGSGFECFESLPADTVELTPSTISNDITRITRVCGKPGTTSVDDIERWHCLGIPVLAKLPCETPRSEVVSAYLSGFDGIVAADSQELQYGKTDVSALARMNELARKVCKLQKPDGIMREGRMGLFQLESIDVEKDDPDLTRLNAYARIRRLAAFAKEPEGIDFVLALPPRPELVPKKLPTKNRLGPNKAEIGNELWERKHFLNYDAAVDPWVKLANIAKEESLIGFADPGVTTCCWRDAENERIFVERRLEIVRRKFGPAVELLRCAAPRNAHQAKPPKALSEPEQEQRRIYDLIPEMDMLPETVIRMRIEYMLDRLNGKEIKPLPPLQKSIELDLDDSDFEF